MQSSTVDVTQSSPEALNTLRTRLSATRRKLLTPPKDLKLSEWADEYRYLGFSSPMPGRWRTDHAPYQREILDVAGNYSTQRLVFMASVQVGKTAMLENVIGFHMDNDPAPIMLVMPSEEMAKSFSQTKLDPMLDESPVLRALRASKNKRDGGNNTLGKVFPGGFIALASAKAADTLRSRTIRVLLLDEVDAYEAISEEGDPVQIAEARTTNWPNRKVILCSTPTLKEFSRIEKEFNKSDRRFYHVPCPHCDHYQPLKFGGRDFAYGLKWKYLAGEENAKNRALDPTTVAYMCESCGQTFDDSHKHQLLSRGRWVAQNPTSRTPGFHISSLYSPWVRWVDLVEQWLEVQELPDKQQEFINLKLGEPYEDKSNKIEVHELASHQQQYDAECPTGVGLITAGVDVQHEWLEVGVWGFGEDEQMWLLSAHQLVGDTTQNEVWDQLAAVLRQNYKTAHGAQVQIRLAGIDAGDRQTMVLEKIARLRKAGLRCIPVKGGLSHQRATFQWSPNKPKIGFVGDSAVKDILYARLKAIHTPGKGYIQFPADVEPEVLHQILAERRVTIYGKGKAPTVQWVRLRPRNEQLDCMKYAYAIRYALTTDVAGFIDASLKELGKQEPASATPDSPSPPPSSDSPAIIRTTLDRHNGFSRTPARRPLGRFSW